MTDDASLERFLAAAAPLRGNTGSDPHRMLELLGAMRLDGDDALAGSLRDALEISAAVTTPAARNAAIARYAFERVAIAIEVRLRSPDAAGRCPIYRSSASKSW